MLFSLILKNSSYNSKIVLLTIFIYSISNWSLSVDLIVPSSIYGVVVDDANYLLITFKKTECKPARLSENITLLSYPIERY